MEKVLVEILNLPFTVEHVRLSLLVQAFQVFKALLLLHEDFIQPLLVLAVLCPFIAEFRFFGCTGHIHNAFNFLVCHLFHDQMFLSVGIMLTAERGVTLVRFILFSFVEFGLGRGSDLFFLSGRQISATAFVSYLDRLWQRRQHNVHIIVLLIVLLSPVQATLLLELAHVSTGLLR